MQVSKNTAALQQIRSIATRLMDVHRRAHPHPPASQKQHSKLSTDPSREKTLAVDSSRQPSTSNPVPITIPSLNLSYDDVLDDIICSLEEMQLPRAVIHRLENRTRSLASDLIKSYNDIFFKTCQQLIANPMDQPPISVQLQALSRTYINSFTHSLVSIKSTIVSKATSWRAQHAQSSEKRSTFNNEFTPLLEKYFEYNAYPSARDRMRLAQKSMMSPRQIEVWFQNHRRRSRKDSRPLRRLSSHPLPQELDLDSLEKAMPDFFRKRHKSVESSSDDEPVIVRPVVDHAQVVDPVKLPGSNPLRDIPRPPTAFPAQYLPGESLWAVNISYAFAPPVWARKPAPCSPLKPVTAVDVVELANKFTTQLNIRGNSSRSRQPKEMWFASKVIVPFSAPHPALLPLSTTESNRPLDFPSPQKATLYPSIRLPGNITDIKRLSSGSRVSSSSSTVSDISCASSPSSHSSSRFSPDPPTNYTPSLYSDLRPTITSYRRPTTSCPSARCFNMPPLRFGFSHFPPVTLIGS